MDFGEHRVPLKADKSFRMIGVRLGQRWGAVILGEGASVGKTVLDMQPRDMQSKIWCDICSQLDLKEVN